MLARHKTWTVDMEENGPPTVLPSMSLERPSNHRHYNSGGVSMDGVEEVVQCAWWLVDSKANATLTLTNPHNHIPSTDKEMPPR